LLLVLGADRKATAELAREPHYANRRVGAGGNVALIVGQDFFRAVFVPKACGDDYTRHSGLLPLAGCSAKEGPTA
jgi:hypothetical protein